MSAGKCVICRYGERAPGRATVTITRGDVIMVVRNVPAEICDACGEEYFDEQTTSRLLEEAEEAERSGIQFVLREFVAA